MSARWWRPTGYLAWGPVDSSDARLWPTIRNLWVREVSVQFSVYGFHAGTRLLTYRELPEEIAPGWHKAYKAENRYGWVYAAAPLHLVLRFWDRALHRGWALHHLACWLGFLALPEEGGYYRDGRWTWRFWEAHRENKSRWAPRDGWLFYLRRWMNAHPWRW